VRDKLGLDIPIGRFLPSDVFRADRMAHVEELDLRADVDKHGVRLGLQKLGSFKRRKMLHELERQKASPDCASNPPNRYPTVKAYAYAGF
jgi:hypothetical protein